MPAVEELERTFDPGQLRDDNGRWVDMPDAVSALKDVLNLAERIDLQPGEKLVGSDKVSGHYGTVRLALTDRDGSRSLRLGLGDDLFGGRDDEDGPWRGAPSSSDNPSGYTANLGGHSAAQLRSALSGGLEAARADKAVNEDGVFGRTFAEGSVPGEWADVHYSVYVDDPDLGLRVVLGAVPHDSGRDLSDLADYEQAASLNEAETRKLLRLLGRYTGDASRSEVALMSDGITRMLSGDAGDTRTGASSQGPKGGQFAVGGGRVSAKGKAKPAAHRPAGKPAAKPAPPKPLSFDGKHGTGYGIKGGDPRVRTLQSVLNRFGLTDSSGRPLAVDGKYGPLTTSAVKKLQKAMGVDQTGVVDDAFLKRVSSAKSLSELRPAKPTKAAPRKAPRRPVRQRQGYRETGRSMLPDFMDPGDAGEFGDGFEDVDTSPPTDRHVLDNGICVTCKMRDQMSEPHVFNNGVCVTCESARSVQALVDALDEVFRTRYVRTPAGAKKYGLPIGSPIGGDHGPHVPKPAPGKKGTLKDRLVSAITEHLDGKGDGKPLAGFNREQLRQAAKSRGIKLDRGEHEDSIAEKLIAHARGDNNDAPKLDTPEPVKPTVKKVAKKAAPNRPEPVKAPSAPDAPKQSSPKIAKLQDDLAKLRTEAHPIAEAYAKWLEGHQISGAAEQRRRDEALAEIRAEAEGPTRQLLDALIARDGSPFGGDDTDSDRWVTPKAWDTTSRNEKNPPADPKARDRYVITDANTIKQNASLRSGQPTPEAQSWAKRMRRMVRATQLNNDSKLHRGAAMPPEQIVALRPGAVLHDSGIMSTDLSADQADFYARTRLERVPGTIKTMFELRVPKGTPAADVGLGEIVLDHGSRWRVVSTRMDEGFQDLAETKKGPVVHVVLEYVGGDP